MKRLLTLLSRLVVVFFASCNNESASEKIARLEPLVFAADGTVNKEAGAELADAYVQYAKENPQDEMSPDMIFKALDFSVNVNIDNPQKSIEIADFMIEAYPQHALAPMAMFIKGFVYETISDIPNAKETYRVFLEKYPDSPLAQDVKASLKNAGISLDELVRQFEEE